MSHIENFVKLINMNDYYKYNMLSFELNQMTCNKPKAYFFIELKQQKFNYFGN